MARRCQADLESTEPEDELSASPRRSEGSESGVGLRRDLRTNPAHRAIGDAILAEEIPSELAADIARKAGRHPFVCPQFSV